MCVIISRNPGIEIEEAKIASACLVNPDGYGISVIDRGKIETIREYDPKGNNATRVLKVLEDAKDHKVFVHLRFSTKGAKNVDNCHPFSIYKHDGDEALFMHNGTIHDFGNTEICDSRDFCEKILGPMAEMHLKGDKESSIFDNELFKRIVEKYRPSSSIFTMFKADGTSLIMGSGVQHEGWWSSNDYSFNRSHRSQDSSGYYSYTNYHSGSSNSSHVRSDSWYQWKERQLEKDPAWRLGDYFNKQKNSWGRWSGSYWDTNNILNRKDERVTTTPDASEKTEVTTSTGNALTVVPNNNAAANGNSATSSTSATTAGDNTIKELMENCAAIGAAIAKSKKANLEPVELTHPEARPTFTEYANIDNLEQVTMLDEEQLYEICERFPLAATMLLMDLIYELYQKKIIERTKAAAEANAAAITTTTEDKKAVNQ